MALADVANKFVNDAEPWKLARDPSRRADLHRVCSVALNAFHQLTVYLKPILPELARKAEHFLNVAPLAWADAAKPLLDHVIKPYEPLVTRIEQKAIDAMIAEEAAEAQPSAAAPASSSASHITIDDFAKIDLRVARVDHAEVVDGSDKLLRLTLDLGALGKRNVFAGIKAHYAPEQLKGKLVVVVANLAPRKMKFGVSEGMVLAGSDESGLAVLTTEHTLAPGAKIS
jgi:methionyl-tRNA synthetase